MQMCDETHGGEEMRIVNLTPHPLVFATDTGDVTVPPDPSGPARVAVMSDVVGSVQVDGHNIPVHHVAYGDPTGLPEPQDGTIYVVSRVVADRVGRADVMVADDFVRDDQGRIVAAKALARVD